jgi:hypothetical protein
MSDILTVTRTVTNTENWYHSGVVTVTKLDHLVHKPLELVYRKNFEKALDAVSRSL